MFFFFFWLLIICYSLIDAVEQGLCGDCAEFVYGMSIVLVGLKVVDSLIANVIINVKGIK